MSVSEDHWTKRYRPVGTPGDEEYRCTDCDVLVGGSPRRSRAAHEEEFHGKAGTPSTFGMIEALEKGGQEYEARVTETARTLLMYEHRMGRAPEGDWDTVTDRVRASYRRAAEENMLRAGVL